MSDFFDDPEHVRAEVAPNVHALRCRDPTAAEAVATLDAAWDAVRAAIADVPEPRWWHKREVAKALRAREVADRKFQNAFAGIARARVGAVPGEWGLLSDDIESTVDAYLKRDTGEALSELLTDIRSCLRRGCSRISGIGH